MRWLISRCAESNKYGFSASFPRLLWNLSPWDAKVHIWGGGGTFPSQFPESRSFLSGMQTFVSMVIIKRTNFRRNSPPPCLDDEQLCADTVRHEVTTEMYLFRFTVWRFQALTGRHICFMAHEVWGGTKQALSLAGF